MRTGGWGGVIETSMASIPVHGERGVKKCVYYGSKPTAFERRGNDFNDFKDFYLKAKVRIWH